MKKIKKLARTLRYNRVKIALANAQDPFHQLKFMKGADKAALITALHTEIQNEKQ